MEILIAIAVSFVASSYKWLANKFGLEQGKKLILGLVFVLCLVSAILYTKEIVTLEMVKSWASLVLLAVGWYEFVIKLIVTPAVDKFIK